MSEFTDRLTTHRPRELFIAGTVVGIVIGVAATVLLRQLRDFNVRSLHVIQASNCLGRSGKAIAKYMQEKGRAPTSTEDLAAFDPSWLADVTALSSDWDARIDIYWQCIGEPEAPIWGVTHPESYDQLPNATFLDNGQFSDLRSALYPDGSVRQVSADELSAALRIVAERTQRPRPE